MEQKNTPQLESVGYFNNKLRKHNLRYKLNQGVFKVTLQELTNLFRSMLPDSVKNIEKLTCFISHADDGGESTQWVKWFGRMLERAGFEVLLDVWLSKYGEDLTAVSEKLTASNIDFIVMVGTPLYVERYKNKDNKELVALEIRLMNHLMLDSKASLKIFPVLLRGTPETSFPPLAQIKTHADFCMENYNFLLAFDLVKQMHINLLQGKFKLSSADLKVAHEKYKHARTSFELSLEIIRKKELHQAQDQYLAKVVGESQKLTQSNERQINAILEKQLVIDTESINEDEAESKSNSIPLNIDADDLTAIMKFADFNTTDDMHLSDKLNVLEEGLESLGRKYGNDVDTFIRFYHLAMAYKKSGIKAPTAESVQAVLQTYKYMKSSQENQPFDSNAMMIAVRQQQGVNENSNCTLTTINRSVYKPFNFNLPDRNRDFNGREHELRDLIKYINENYISSADKSSTLAKLLVLAGLGGIGKTQLTLEMVYQILDYPTQIYSLVAWLDAEQGLNEQYLLLIEKCGIKVSESINHKTRYEELLTKFKGRILLILDNVKDYEQVRALLPMSSIGEGRLDIIIITQSQIWNTQKFYLYEVTGFTKEESVECITKRLADVSLEQAERLASTLHYFPLALYQAISYLEQTSSDIDIYLTEYHSQKKVFLNDSLMMNDTNKATVYATLRMAVTGCEDKLRSMKGSQQETVDKLMPLLKICAYLNANDILRKMLAQLMTEMQLNHILMVLHSYSLVKITKDKQTISFHPLVQEIIRAEIEEEDINKKTNEESARWIQAAFALINDSIQFNYDHPENWGLENKLLMHAKTVMRYAQLNKVTLGEGELLKQESFNQLESTMDKQAVIVKLVKALTYEEQNTGSQARMVALKCDLGDLYRSQGKFPEAIEYYQSAIALTHSLKSSNEEKACLCLKLGHAYRESGDYRLAESELQTALKLFKDYYNISHPHVGLVYNYLGLVAHATEDYSQAISYYNEAIPSLQQHFGENHPVMARPYNNLGLSLSHQGKYRNAILLFTRALTFYEEYSLFKNAKLELGIINLNLANSIMYSGNYKKALHHCTQAFIALSNNPREVYVYFTASRIYENFGDNEKALEYLKHGLTLCKQYYNVRLSKIMSNISNPSVVWQSLKHNEGDYATYEQIAEITVQMFTENHREVAYVLNKLGMLYKNEGIHDKALECFEKALKIAEELGIKSINLQNLQLIKNNIDFSTQEMDLSATTKKQRSKP